MSSSGTSSREAADMGLSILLVIIASVVLGFILGAFVARPRRWDTYICADDTIHADATRDHGR
jgi:uncharacterized protein YneF (UPF0154 family)